MSTKQPTYIIVKSEGPGTLWILDPKDILSVESTPGMISIFLRNAPTLFSATSKLKHVQATGELGGIGELIFTAIKEGITK